MTDNAAQDKQDSGHSERGSRASRDYLEQLAREGRDVVLADHRPIEGATARPATNIPPEARTALRKKVIGKVQVTYAGSLRSGKFVDLSETGACVLFEDTFPQKTQCILACEIFMSGKRFVFATHAVSVYAVLASGSGVKVGFQFGPRDEAAVQSIKAVLAL